MALFSIWFGRADDSNHKHRRVFRKKKWKEVSLFKRVQVVFRLYLKHFLEVSNNLFGQGIAQDFEATLEYKVVMMGFGLLILIIASAYFANLAAFLTLPGVAEYIGTMEQAVAQNSTICIPDIIGPAASQAWPDAKFLFIPTSDFADALLQAYEDGQCDMLTLGSISSEKNLDKMCALNLAFTSSLITTVAVALPISQELSRELSYYLSREYAGFEMVYKNTKPGPMCNLDFDASQTASDTTALTPANLVLPFAILTVCTMLSYLVHVYHMKDTTDDSEKVPKFVGRDIFHEAKFVKNIEMQGSIYHIEDTEKVPEYLGRNRFHEAKLTKNIETRSDVTEEFSELLDKMAGSGIDSTSNIVVVPILVDKHQEGRKELVRKYLSEIEQALEED